MMKKKKWHTDHHKATGKNLKEILLNPFRETSDQI